MARLYRRPDRDNVYFIDLKDARGIRRGVKGYPSKRHTEELARRLEQLRDARQTGAPIPPDARKWLETQPPDRIRHFADLGFLAPDAAAVGLPLRRLLAEWIAALEAKGRDERYVFQNRRHVEGLLDDAGFAYWNDVTPARIASALDAYVQREDLSARTRNARLVAFRGFNRWCVKQGRALADHTITLELSDVRLDRRTVRRALPPEHLQRLLAAALADDEVVYCLTGRERSLVYLTAASTGWRWSELRRLQRRDFRLDATPPYLAPPAHTQKAGREDSVPLRTDVAKVLSEYFSDHPLPPDALAFPMPKSNAGAKLLRHDLARTGDDEQTAAAKTAQGETPQAAIPYQDEHGEVADFHALRHALATMLGDAKADVKSAQTIMRHSDPSLTLNIYTHTKREKQAAILETLPALIPPPEPSAQPAVMSVVVPTNAPGATSTLSNGLPAPDGDSPITPPDPIPAEPIGSTPPNHPSPPDNDDDPTPQPPAPNPGGGGGEGTAAPGAVRGGPTANDDPTPQSPTLNPGGGGGEETAMSGSGVSHGGMVGAEACGGGMVGTGFDTGRGDCPIVPESAQATGVNEKDPKPLVPQGKMESERLLTHWNKQCAPSSQPSPSNAPGDGSITNIEVPLSATSDEPCEESGLAPGLIRSDIHQQSSASDQKSNAQPSTPTNVTKHEKTPTSEEMGVTKNWHPLRDSNPCSQTENLVC